MKKLSINFRDGREVLKSYWGYLSGGGLVLERQDLREGQSVMLNLVIEQSHLAQSVCGTVVRRHPSRDESIVALEPGDSRRLLQVALADADVDVVAELSDFDHAEDSCQVRLVNVSETGCCVRVDDEHAFPVGSDVELSGPGFDIVGCVVWAVGSDRGVMFSADEDPNGSGQLSLYLDTLR